MIKLIFILLIISACSKVEYVPQSIEGTYKIDGIILNLDNELIDGYSDCNDLYGSYQIQGDSIHIKIGGTKVYCDGETQRIHLNNTFKYEIHKNSLLLIGTDYEIIFDKIY